MKRLILTLLVSNILTLVCAAHAQAQAQPLNIDDCMRYAVKSSTTVGMKHLAHDDSNANYNEALASLFPAVNASVGGATNFGRGIDPATNAYTNVTTFSNSYGLSGSMPLFNGLNGINTVRAMKVAKLKGAVDTEIARDEDRKSVV